VYCDAPAAHVDHVIPRSRGGSDDIDNLVPACARCNLSKGARTLQEWALLYPDTVEHGAAHSAIIRAVLEAAL